MKKSLAIAALVTLAAVVVARRAHAAGDDKVARGRYLVTMGGCNDCHTPLRNGPEGPMPDLSRLLSGHPQDLKMPPAPALMGPWVVAASATLTAWSGPWGISFATNLTPDIETGLGRWAERDFMDAMRTCRHQGRGRTILPPMPVQNVAAMTDADLSAVFAYLRSIPPVRNEVPQPLPPAMAAAEPARK